MPVADVPGQWKRYEPGSACPRVVLEWDSIEDEALEMTDLWLSVLSEIRRLVRSPGLVKEYQVALRRDARIFQHLRACRIRRDEYDGSTSDKYAHVIRDMPLSSEQKEDRAIEEAAIEIATVVLGHPFALSWAHKLQDFLDDRHATGQRIFIHQDARSETTLSRLAGRLDLGVFFETDVHRGRCAHFSKRLANGRRPSR